MSRALATWFLSLSLLVAAAAQTSAAPKIKQIFGFPCDTTLSQCPDGSFPQGFIESADGNFYGIAVAGGVGLNSQGTVFKITATGEFTLLYSFAEQPDGSLPNGAAPTALVEGLDGNLYGLTLVDGGNGLGTAFRLTKSGVITLLHNFCNTLDCHDGANPSFLTLGIDGKFYGATGPNGPPTSVLFRMSEGGGYKVLHTFDTSAQPDGTGVFGMLQLPDGNFYGTTVAGEQLKPWNSVFRFDPVTAEYTILHGFNSPDLNLPNVASSGLTLASDGNLYGLRVGSVLYRITPGGKYHEIGPVSPTQFIDGGLIQASDGNFWGTFFGVPGIVFSTTPNESFLANIRLSARANGSEPFGPIQAADGKLYGMSFMNGAPENGQPTNGSFWVIDAGLPPPLPQIINFQPTTNAPGSTFLIQGSHFVGTTEVTINGVSAHFKVLTANFIRVTVPAGASSGKISITNAGGTSTSANSFTVQ